ncbi:kinase-like domain-containing protein [Rhexocercosporidium sp. MPI-PUGE-AT-0058]|nr:kinase-like domain-containing protein [Rhexocercosporidium sp. MPI-PUGE-AT-0058]
MSGLVVMDELVVEDVESGRKGDKIAKTILGAGTSSVVYLVDKNKAEKRFKSSNDLLNEQTIYQILGSHPRLVSIYHFGAEGIIMDWMEKGDLARYIKSHPEVAQRRKHQWITQIAESFSLLHKHHISHCDSKLENFLLDDDYDIKICDFASSHNYRAPSNDPAIQPPRYRRAVDDFDETVFNPADDIFAFGSICYEIITGGPPYPQLDDEGVRLRFTRGDFPATGGLCFGPIIRDCWNGTYVSFEAILRSIEREKVLRGQNQIL